MRPVSSIVVMVILCLALTGCNDEKDSSPTSSASPSAKSAEVVSSSYIISEKNQYAWYFSWKARIKNKTSRDLNVFFKVKFKDGSNYVVDSNLRSGEIAAGATREFSEKTIILPDQAKTVARMNVEIVDTFLP